MVPEAPLEQTEHGLVPAGDGWFVLNARDAAGARRRDAGAYSDLEGDREFQQLGIHLVALGPGEPMSMYHWEADQEDFLVLFGEALLIVAARSGRYASGTSNRPDETNHVIVGAGEANCLVLAVGARDRSRGPDWGGYPVDETALRHGAGVEQATTDAEEAYAHVRHRQRPTTAKAPASDRPSQGDGAGHGVLARVRG